MALVTCDGCGVVYEKEDWRVKERNYCKHECYAVTLRKKVDVQCAHCNKTVQRVPSKVRTIHFCSNRCRGDYDKTTVMLECEVCGKSFERKSGHVHEHNFCSRDCHNVHQSKRITIQCFSCGKELVRPPCQVKYERHFCSTACKSAAKIKPLIIPCTWCNAMFERFPWHMRENNFCSDKCRHTWHSQATRGEKSAQWLGGWKSYYGLNWKSQKREARKRDGYTCRRCGKSQKEHRRALDVHHIKPFREFNYIAGQNENYLEANHLDNLVTLCSKCHGEAEREGRKTYILHVKRLTAQDALYGL